MDIGVEKHPEAAVLTIGGELDLTNLPDAAVALDGVFSELQPCLVVNCAGLTLVTSSAISFLVDATQRARAFPGGDAVVSAPPDLLRRSLELLNLDGWMTIAADDAAALAYFRERNLEETVRNETKPPANWRERLRDWLKKN